MLACVSLIFVILAIRATSASRSNTNDDDTLSTAPSFKSDQFVFGRDVHAERSYDGPSWGSKPMRCPAPPTIAWFAADGMLHFNCSRSQARWAAWPDHRSANGGFLWQRLPKGPPPYRTSAEVVVARCGNPRAENWLQRVVPTPAGKATRASTASPRRPPDVAVIFLDSVTRQAFASGAFPRTLALLRQLNGSGDDVTGAAGNTRLFSFPMYHGLPCCTKNWIYSALGGVYNPTRNGQFAPHLAKRTPWVWSHGFEKKGYVTHVSNDVCYPSELQDWWRHEDNPLLVNVSDHPAMLDTFCRRKPVDAATSSSDAAIDGLEPTSFQTRWDGVQYAARLDAGESICLAGKTLASRWLDYAHDFLTHDGYGSTPRFSLTLLNDVHCKCKTGSYHLDHDVADFLTKLIPSLHRTIVVLVSDHGLLESFEHPPEDLHMPLLTMLVPRPLLRQSPNVANALEMNQRRLVTPFDIYHTLTHIPTKFGPRGGGRSSEPAAASEGVDGATWREFRDAFEANSAHSPLPWGRVPKAAGGFAEMGQSLLRPLPPERDCEAAGIPQSVCRLERRAGGG